MTAVPKPLKQIVTSLSEWDKINMKARNFLLAHPERSFLVIMQSDYEVRSINLNNYYHGVVIPTIQNFILETQKRVATASKVHTDLKRAFFPVKAFIDAEGKILTKQSTVVHTKEFLHGLECIWAHYDQNGCYIPKPNEVITLDKEVLLF